MSFLLIQDTLFSVLYTMVRVFAPFTPFLTEHMYQNLKHQIVGTQADSVHYLMIPDAQKELIDVDMERAVARYSEHPNTVGDLNTGH